MKKLYLLLVAVTFFFAFEGKATHTVGGTITYKYAGNDSFDVTVIIYRDCNGMLVTPDSLRVKNACGTTAYWLPAPSRRDITGIPTHCSIKSRCAVGGTYGYGIEEWKYVLRIGLGSVNNNCCNYTISWQQCCRNLGISMPPSKAFYIEAKINRCAVANNSSPVIQSLPRMLLPLGANLSINYKAYDPDGDLLTYQFVEPYSGADTPITYTGLWSTKRPISFLGFPDETKKLPSGFWVDSLTGIVKFRPSVKDQVTYFAMKVTEWRKINGTLTKIGEITRDEQIIVYDGANNNPPKFVQPDEYTIHPVLNVCSINKTYCHYIYIEDSDTNDSLSFNYLHDLKNISFTNIGKSNNKAVIQVCYTPDSAERASGKALEFSIEVSDNVCPLAGITNMTFEYKITPGLPDSFAIIKKLLCKNLQFSIQNTSATVKTPAPKFEVVYANKPLQLDSINGIKNIPGPGWYFINMRVTSPTHCDTLWYNDSLYVSPNHFISVDAGNYQKVCSQPNVTLTATVVGGAASYTYKWNTGDSIASPIFTPPLGENKYFVTATDSNNCTATDSVSIGYYNPQVAITGTERQCIGKPIKLKATITNAYKPTYQWTGFTANLDSITTTATANDTFNFTLNDSGCVVTKMASVIVYNPSLTLTHPAKYCVGDSVILSASASGGLAPYSFNWVTYSTTGSTVYIGKPTVNSYTYTTTVTDSFGCTASNSGSFVVNALPVISVSSLSPACETKGAIDLTPFASPSGGQWTGTGVTGNTLNTYTAGVGIVPLTYQYTNTTTGCSDKSSTSIIIQPQPKARFSVDSGTAHITHAFKFTDKSTPIGLRLWNFGDPNSGSSNTDTSANPTHTFSDTGYYIVMLTLPAGVCMADTVFTSVVVIKSSPKSILGIEGTAYKIYPNPAHSSITIEGEEISSLEIYDLQGRRQQIIPTEVSINKYDFDIRNLAAGMYFIKIMDTFNKEYQTNISIIH